MGIRLISIVELVKLISGVKMKIKTAILALLLLSIPAVARAENVEDSQNLQVGCNSGAECNNFDVIYQQNENDEIAQRTRTRRTRRRGSDQKIYAGGTLGVFFPSDIDDTIIEPDTGFGGSIYGGYKFTDLISADAEVVLAFGGNDFEDITGADLDGSYTLFGFFLNPRFTYSFDQNSDRSFYVFASPGIGIGSISIGDEVGDRIEDNGGEDSGSGFAIQGKIGAGYPISNSIDIVGQARYINIFDVAEVPQDGDVEEESINSFSIELGANFKF